MKRLGIATIVCLIVLAVVIVLQWRSEAQLSRAAADRLLEIAIQNADKGRNDIVAEQLARILKDVPDHHRAREMQATMYVNMRKPKEVEEAISFLPDEYLAERFDESLALAKFMTGYGFLYEAEPLLRRLLIIRPQNAVARKELLKCLRIGGQNHAAAPFLEQSLRQRQIERDDLFMASAPRLFWANVDDVKFMKRVGQKHEDSLTMLGYATRETQNGEFKNAIQILKQLLIKRPDWHLAWVRLASVYWLTGDEERWEHSMQGWSPDQSLAPDAWFLLGVWHRQHGQLSVAVRCFSETLAGEPKHIGAWAQLLAVLHELKFDAEAQRIKPYSERLAQIEQYCQDLAHETTPEMVAEIARECAAAGWHGEARAWVSYGKLHWKSFGWTDIETRLNQDPATQDSAPPSLKQLVPTLDIQQFPLPQPMSGAAQLLPVTNATAVDAPGWSLEDEAETLGIHFQFQNGLDPERGRAYMFEFAGPGVGVLDYDGDGWPDLHLTQGAPWPVKSDNTTLKDELFHNQGDGTFQPVAEPAGVGEPGYSQGPAAGDFDSDGFPDLYICNIGPNRGYRNNGDGTFSEITAEAGFAGDDWSISAAWADFNVDGLLDLYVVNYLTGDVFERACRAADGRPVQCPPMQFPAADDRLYLNRGDGTFEDISAPSGMMVPDGKGMGIVVGRVSMERLGIFIANDTTANHLFTKQVERSPIPHFEEVGALAGVAFGPRGNAQSSMGIAAGDVNGDGRLDLFVTNWMAESSNLFLQRAGGAYEDQAHRYGITADGLMMEGWGAQFCDIDADGRLDLFVANGHLEEKDSRGGRMPPHLFRNRDGKHFDFVAGPKIGRYFQRQYLGRSVAVWDWNRDGQQDLCVSHTTDPVAILTNRTQPAGHRLSLRLIGVHAARDPIGSQVSVAVGGQTLVREIVSGNGYAATNERGLHFGLGSATENVTLNVNWSDGTSQSFADLAPDTEYVLIQGRPAAISLKRFDTESINAVQ